MDIFARLKQDHVWQRELSDRIIMAPSRSTRRRQLFDEFRREVTAHAEAEEQTFYAALIEHLRGQHTVSYSLVDHEDCIDVLSKLEKLDTDDSEWMENFLLLKQGWEIHINEEETVVFDCARSLFSQRQIRHLAELFDDRKRIQEAEAGLVPALAAAEGKYVLTRTSANM